jgi:hypothetical protein
MVNCYWQVSDWSSPGGMWMNYHQATVRCWYLEQQGLLTTSCRPREQPHCIAYRPHNTRGVPLWLISLSVQFKSQYQHHHSIKLHKTGSKYWFRVISLPLGQHFSHFLVRWSLGWVKWRKGTNWHPQPGYTTSLNLPKRLAQSRRKNTAISDQSQPTVLRLLI